MDQLFLIKLALSFITGAVVVAFSTVISERIGTRFGGIFAAMPNTIIVTSVFIAWTQDAAAAVEATRSMPVAIIGVFCYLIAYYYSSLKFPKSFLKPIILALFAWFATVVLGSFLKLDMLLLGAGVAIFSIPAFIVLFGQPPNPQAKKPKASNSELLMRGILGGLVVCAAVIVTKYLSIFYGGSMGAFPAVLTSSFAILHYRHGSGFVREFMRTVPFGTVGLFVFAYSANQFYLVRGVILGTFYGWILSAICILILYLSIPRFFDYASFFKR
ncbi:MAG: DUF3147 family protein [Candidatus Micrarchaeota archaeon]